MEWSEAIERCERRDPAGHAVHLGFGLTFMFVLPLGTAPSILVSIGLIAMTVLRWWVVAPVLLRMLRWPPVPAAALLIAWLALSLAWSAAPERGAHLLLSLRVLLLPFVLAPLLGRRGWLAAALLSGITLQALVQCGQYALHRGAWNFDGMARFGGFTSDPGKAGLWDAIGVCGGAALALACARRWAISGACIALVALFGTIASGTRRQLVALGVAIPLLFAWVLATARGRWQRALLIGGNVIVALAAAWPIVGPSIMVRLRQTAAQVDASADAPPIRGIVHYDLRGYYWHAALEGFREHPLRGLGLGGASRAIAGSSLRPSMEAWLGPVIAREYPERTADENARDVQSRLDSNHPHSTWLQLLAEGGLIGLALGLAAWFLALTTTLARSLADGGRDPITLGAAAALLLWGVGAIFDASINSTSLGAVAVLALLGGAMPAASRRAHAC